MKKEITVAALGLIGLFAGCTRSEEIHIEVETDQPEKIAIEERLTLDLAEAQRLVQLPLGCIDTEYPNKLGQVIDEDADLRSPQSLHPAFYGCFDWHSAVHGHWSLVRLAKAYPEMKESARIIEGLKRHLTKENIAQEVIYFDDAMSQGFERMYGWAWLLKLAEELHTWEHADAPMLEENLKPLTDVIVKRCKEFLPKLAYPIRVGTHTNTAFAMGMAFDYALEIGDQELMELIEEKGKAFYLTDKQCPLSWEPSGYDFLSPCLEEADLMRRILSKEAFKTWLAEFLPGLQDPNFTLKPGIVADRTDGHLVHLDGLNFSRAWCLLGIASDYPEEFGHLTAIANQHIQHSLPEIVDDHYEGGHWLASFALLALSE